MILANFTQVDYQELVENGSGLAEFLLFALVIFLLALPFYLIRAFLRKEVMKSAVDRAGGFATRAAIAVFVCLPFCVVVLGVPFGILNVVGMAIFGQQFYWPFIAPGLIFVYGAGTTAVLWSVRNERRQASDSPREKRGRRKRTAASCDNP